MKIAGITAEYNPLHNGHIYHIEETRRQTGCDVLVVAMSGDFVQRGEPAILDKWMRAGHALDAGADLVVEIPTLFCLGNASQYASASVKMLEALGCSEISFGSESGDIGLISEVAGTLRANREAIDAFISNKIKEGKSYPAARAEAYKEIRIGSLTAKALENELAVLSDPNDILALEYINHMKSASPLAIKRRGAYHGEAGSDAFGYQSAESIRKTIGSEGFAKDALLESVPSYVLRSFKEQKPVFCDDGFDILKYAILSSRSEAIEECPSGGEGLGNLLKSAVKDAENYNDLIMRVKSKRYTYTRISRLCMQMILGISRAKFDFDGPAYIRVLGHDQKGRELLAQIRNESKRAEEGRQIIPVIININKETEKLDDRARDLLDLDIHASEIYGLIADKNRREEAEQRKRPVMK